jgi:hypothetical protein
MDINLSTPALLFPAISLLLLAFANHFLTLSTIIRNMQIFGVASLLFCVFSMFALFAGWIVLGQWLFAAALILIMISL